MYGKLWESMYTGSMMGAGLGPFALMPYVVSNMKPYPNGDSIEMRLELNPKFLAAVLGTKEQVIEKAIEWACSPDPKSRTKTEGGRRLVKIGEFEYRVVNGWAYTQKRAIEKRREQFRKASQKYRKKKAAKEFANPHDGMTQLDKVQQQAEMDGDATTATRCEEIKDGVAPGTYEKDEETPF
jgi:hypothetical protein